MIHHEAELDTTLVPNALLRDEKVSPVGGVRY